MKSIVVSYEKRVGTVKYVPSFWGRLFGAKEFERQYYKSQDEKFAFGNPNVWYDVVTGESVRMPELDQYIKIKEIQKLIS
mgnify:CR=1 FL=1